MITSRRALCAALLGATAVLALAGLLAGSDGWSFDALRGFGDPAAAGHIIVSDIRAPRTLGAWLAGALLGLAGAIAQGLFRNPLADPYLLGSAAGASLAVVLVLAVGSLAGGLAGLGGAAAGSLAQAGIVGAAFFGALGGMLLTLLLARGANQTTSCCSPASSSA